MNISVRSSTASTDNCTACSKKELPRGTEGASKQNMQATVKAKNFRNQFKTTELILIIS